LPPSTEEGLVGDRSKIALLLEYEGTCYYGFQFQDGVPTIQGELEAGIKKLTGEMSRVIAASRTDTGVHARGQVVSFWTGSVLPPRKYIEGLNYYLPQDIAVRAAFRVSDAFRVRSSAVSREYKYCILNTQARSALWRNYSYHVKGKLNIDDMSRACQTLMGRRDFISFASELAPEEMGDTVREVYRAEVVREGEMVVFRIEASSFLRHQVRNTVGVLIRVGLGKVSIDEFRDVIEAREAGRAGPAVPACGLCLERVNYPEPYQERFSENLQREKG
jgi:tRNA pseudouridine38-40 synthase